MPLHLEPTFPLIIWIYTEGEDDGIESRLSPKIFYTYFNNTVQIQLKDQLFYEKKKENHLNLLFFQEALNPKVKIADPKDKTPLPIEEFGKEKAGKVINPRL